MANAERIRQVVALIEEAEKARGDNPKGSGYPGWNQSHWVIWEPEIDNEEEMPICKTAFCFAGWAVYLKYERRLSDLLVFDPEFGWDERDDIHWSQEAREYFGLTDAETTLFVSWPSLRDGTAVNGNIEIFKQFITEVTGVTFPTNEGETHVQGQDRIDPSAPADGGESGQPPLQPQSEDGGASTPAGP